MKEIKQLREEYNKMNEQEINREILLNLVRISRALEKTAHHLENIDDSVEKLKLNLTPSPKPERG